MTNPYFMQHTPPRPPRTELVRTTLLQRLETATDHKLIALIAPSGFGKTTLLSQFARQTRHPVLWVTLTPSDAEPRQLNEVVAAAVQTLIPGWSAASDQPMQRQKQHLIHALNRTDDSIRLVFDQTEHLSNDALKWILDLARHLHEGHQILLGGYENLTPHLVHHLVHGEAHLLGQQDLAFTEGETSTYLARCGHPDEAHKVHQELQGWAAGIALVASGVYPSVTPEHLLQAALDRLAPEVREWLPKASVLSEWSMARFQELGLDMPHHWLSEVQQAGLPIQMIGRNACTPYRLLLGVLDEALQHQPELYRKTHQKAGRLQEQQGHWIQALQHYRQASDPQGVMRLLESRLPALEERWEFGVIRQVLDHPNTPVAFQPHLAEALVQEGEAFKAEHLLQPFMAQQDHPRAFYALGLIQARQGDPSTALKWANRGLLCKPTARLKAKLLRLKVASLHGLNQLAEAVGTAEQAVTYGADLGPLDLLPLLLALQALYLALGRFSNCEKTIQWGLTLSRSQHILRTEVHFLEAQTELCRVTGRTTEAFEHAETALRLAEQEATTHLPVLLETVGDLHAQHGNFTKATQSYQQALTVSTRHQTEILTVRLKYKLSESLCRTHHTDLAHKFLLEARLGTTKIPPWLKHLGPFYEGIHHHLTGNIQQARKHFEEALNCQGIPPERELRAHLYLAAICKTEGLDAASHQHAVQKVLQHLGHEGVLSMDREVLFSTPPPTPTTIKTHDLILSIKTLGGLSIEVNHQPVRVPNAKSRELLVCLALMGSTSRAQLVEALWQDPFDERNLEYFRVCVRRLRLALTDQAHLNFNPVPYERDLYQLSAHFRVQLDVKDLLEAGHSRDEPLLEEALEKHQGEFLPGIDNPWTETWRNRSHEQAVSLALKLGSLQHTQPNAARWYYRALEIEPYCEEAYQALITHHLQQGSIPEARRVLRTYTKMLHEELGCTIDPSWLQGLGLT